MFWYLVRRQVCGALLVCMWDAGYIGSESFLHQIRDVVEEIKKSKPSTLFGTQ